MCSKMIVKTTLVLLLLAMLNIVTLGYFTTTIYTSSLPSLQLKVMILQNYVTTPLNITYNFNGFRIKITITGNLSPLHVMIPSNLTSFISQNATSTNILIPSGSLLAYFSIHKKLEINVSDSTQNASILIQLIQDKVKITIPSTTTFFSTTTNKVSTLSNEELFLILSLLAILVFVLIRFKKWNK